MKMKVGRNDPCPCGSGKKFKKCHGAGSPFLRKKAMNAETEKVRQQAEALEEQRGRQQGEGKRIISTEGAGQRFVAVGNEIMSSSNWKSFHDFLREYPHYIFDADWANSELDKPIEIRHPILQWYEMLIRHHEAYWKQVDEGVKPMPMIGAVAAYMHLSYNLYLLAHNVELQRRLVERLKKPDHFHGAYYETYVFAALIKAGFSIELEDEADGSSSHCECVATSKLSGEKYSVEAKARGVKGVLGKDVHQGSPADGEIKIFNKLRDALGKDSDHKRIVFIDTNVPHTVDNLDWEPWMEKLLTDLRRFEGSMRVWGEEAPPAYVFVTNFPYHHEPDRDDYRIAMMAEGFKIPDFKVGGTFFNLRGAVLARDKHKDIYDLAEKMVNMEIPSTFDGELPEFAFRMTDEPRLIIGRKYLVPNPEGEEVVGELESAAVLENEKMVYGSYHLDSGRRIICSSPISDEELAAYRKAPDTFFGAVHPVPKKSEGPVDLYDSFHSTAKEMTKEKMLEHLEKHPKINDLRVMNQESLAFEYALIYAETAYIQSRKTKTRKVH